MRTAIFVLGMLINSGFQELAKANGHEPGFDVDIGFVAVMTFIFFAMDLIELYAKLRRR